MFPSPWQNALPFAFLIATLLVQGLSPWIASARRYHQPLAAALLVLSIASALWVGLVEWVVVIPLSLLYGVAWCAANLAASLPRYVALLLTVGLAFALATHKLPGFHGQLWLDAVQFSEHSRPFTLIANLDKPWVGAIILLAFAPFSRGTFSPAMCGLWSLGGAVALILVGILLGVPIEPKWQPAIGVFLLHNLFLTCVAEEAFFRLLIQSPLYATLKSWRWGASVSIVMVSLLFGAVHFRTGVPWDVLALVTLGGCVYATVFHVTRSVHWAIATHFLTNALHVLLLRYPLL